MKPYRILKPFKGSQTGHDHDEFVAGTTRDLSKDLAAVVVKEGWAEPVATGGVVPPRPQLLVGEVPNELKSEIVNVMTTETLGGPALFRETKVVGPEETKVVTPEATKSLDEMTFGELKAIAKAKGVKVFGMSEVKLREALKSAA